MCIDGVSHLIMRDENVRVLMFDPRMDLIHQQVLMTLYSLEAGGRLHEYRDVLPLYLSLNWNECSAILDTIEQVGLLARYAEGIKLTYPVKRHDADVACGCAHSSAVALGDQGKVG
jgi:hypothetical protein